jgi:hypothetical protein
MRISFYGALLLAMSVALLFYGGRTSGTNVARSATSNFASAGVIVPDISSDDFDDALATITEVEVGTTDHGRRPMGANLGAAKAPAL